MDNTERVGRDAVSRKNSLPMQGAGEKGSFWGLFFIQKYGAFLGRK
jgi:hypothetical protein